ncbi:hypothetical protein BJ742DRAFT_850614 [Cladochytrium replicatum]|nr:hypothetical protein BJ742DRAFT_850614 [Cladochytrium replicatum]
MRNNPPPKLILPPAIAEIFLYIAMALIELALLLSSSLTSICLASFYLAMIPVVAISSVFDRVGVVTSKDQRVWVRSGFQWRPAPNPLGQVVFVWGPAGSLTGTKGIPGPEVVETRTRP